MGVAAVALSAIAIGCTYAAVMAGRRGAGYVAPYQLLMLSMGLVATGGIGYWALNAHQSISHGGLIVVASSWLANAAASRNYKVNPGVLFFALCQTAATASFEVFSQKQTPIWAALIVGLMWLLAGYGVRADKGSPGWLCLALMAGITMVHVSLDF